MVIIAMIEYPWDETFFAECAAKFAKVEQKLTNVQLEYLRQLYSMNKFPDPTELRELAKRWNCDNFAFYMNLRKWFCGRRMAEQEIIHLRDKARKAAA